MSPIGDDPKAVNISNVFKSLGRNHMDERTYDVEYIENDWESTSEPINNGFSNNITSNIVDALKKRRDTI